MMLEMVLVLGINNDYKKIFNLVLGDSRPGIQNAVIDEGYIRSFIIWSIIWFFGILIFFFLEVLGIPSFSFNFYLSFGNSTHENNV